MKILFVYPNIYAMGGIQTWLSRTVPRLHSDGHEVALLTRPRCEPWDSTSQFVEAVGRDATVHLAGRHWFDLPRSLHSRPEPADVVFACNLPSLLMAVLVQQHLMPEARIVAGVFHPREYSWTTPRLRRRWVQHLATRILRELPAANFMFFSPSEEAHPAGEFLSRDLSASPAIPIPIDTEVMHPLPDRRIERGKVVSVARLAPYYTYIRHMIRVIRDLREQGHAFTYHCHGDGEERSRLEAEARELGVSDAVFFHPAIPYDRFSDSLRDAFAFVGIGTSLLEAAACGVPALVAIDSHPDAATHGFLHETAGNRIGGHVEGHPEYPIAERLLWLAGRTEPESAALEDASRARAEEFSLARLLPRMVGALEQSAPYSATISRADRAIGGLDWLVEAVMLKLGGRDVMAERFTRPTSLHSPRG